MGSYRQPGPRHRLRPVVVAVVLLALIIGLGGGYLLRYTTTSGDSSSTAAASSTAPAPTTPPSSPTNPPCASAADVGAQIVGQLRAAASAIGNLDPSGLEKVLNQIQRLQAQLEQAVTACRHEATTTSVPIPTTSSSSTR